MRSKRERSVGGSCTFSTIDRFGFHRESIGLAAARIDVRALSEQMMPALAIDTVCCSMACNARWMGRADGRMP